VWCDERLLRARFEKDRANIAAALRVKAELRAGGKDLSHGGEVARTRGATHREQLRLNAEWEESSVPTLSEEEYRATVLPGLAKKSVRAIAATMGVSYGYAAQVRKGETVPHPRHWAALQNL